MSVISEVNAEDVIGSIPVFAADAHTAVRGEANAANMPTTRTTPKQSWLSALFCSLCSSARRWCSFSRVCQAPTIRVTRRVGRPDGMVSDPDSGNTMLVSPSVSLSPSPSESPSPEVTVQSVSIIWTVDGLPKTDVSMKGIGDTLTFNFETRAGNGRSGSCVGKLGRRRFPGCQR